MNFNYLAQKYLGVDCIVHDRTYDGLEFPKGTEKPPIEVFQSFQREEERQAKARGLILENQESEMMLKQHQARIQAAIDAIPHEIKVNDETERVYDEALELKKQAIEIKAVHKLKGAVDEAWREITEAQARINDEAHKYLSETAHHLERAQHGLGEVPAEIAEKRKEAFKRVSEGSTVFARWQELRAKEMPSRQELHDAIVAGGAELERMKKICREIQLKYPKPKRV